MTLAEEGDADRLAAALMLGAKWLGVLVALYLIVCFIVWARGLRRRREYRRLFAEQGARGRMAQYDATRAERYRRAAGGR